jgi:hypothetical protein
MAKMRDLNFIDREHPPEDRAVILVPFLGRDGDLWGRSPIVWNLQDKFTIRKTRLPNQLRRTAESKVYIFLD